MGKITAYDFSGMPEEVIDFKDDVVRIINFGKYASQVLYNNAYTPTWSGREGENVMSYVGAGGTFLAYNFYWLNSAWRYTTFGGAT